MPMSIELTAVIICWKDATLHGTRQYTRKEFEQEVPLTPGCGCGWLVDEGEDYITIAIDFFDTSKGEGEGDFRLLASYPKSGIHAIYRCPVTL